MTLDTDDLPKTWNLKWVSPSLDLDVDVAVKSTSILKVWGAPNLPQTRKELVYIPLVLDSEGSIRKNKVEKPIRGFGLAEYWRMPEV